ncbi:AraC family transcriptional regulator [Klebsiella pneumoniae]|uniref:AraC family transcriptional regulator n=1 Tax=Klebsiella pneumoniae TaxID=573 RepID=A0A3S4GUK4_KLEPN|nr:AraC family transcriptional regulator [Klebsiella pneumoniae]
MAMNRTVATNRPLPFRIRVVEAEQYIPAHSHRKGQLILALHGALTCEVENAMWMVPPQYAVWVPGQLSHSNRATPGAQVCFLFIEPGAAPMPDRCCTLKISPLVRELILTLAERGGESLAAPATARLVQVLFDELPASRRSTCSCRYQTTRKFVKW